MNTITDLGNELFISILITESGEQSLRILPKTDAAGGFLPCLLTVEIIDEGTLDPNAMHAVYHIELTV